MPTAMPRPVRLLVVGTGNMANQHATDFARIPGVTLVGAVDTRPDVLAAFQARHAIPAGYATVEEAIAAGGFDAVTNVTTDAAHCPTTLPFLAAGKHVLCEKPLATNHADADRMADAARAAGVVAMVNLSYRNGPALQRAAEMVAEGAIGPVRHLEASYLQSWLVQSAWGDWRSGPSWLWRLSKAHGSKGTLGDIGIHILDFATFVAGEAVTEVSARLQVFDKAPGGRIGEYVLDANDSVTMQIRLSGGGLGTIAATRFAAGHMNDLRLRLYGEKGGVEVRFEANQSALRACLGADVATATWVDVPTPDVPTNFQRFIAAIRGDGPAVPDFDRGAALQKVLDAAEASDAAGGLAQAV
jgi:predicted dehydrogenase